jgi:proline dehydrogenase
MMRHFFLFLSKQKQVRRFMESSPLSRKFTRRFVAGESLDDALAVLANLQREKIWATLDHLGENVTSMEEAAQSRNDYLAALTQLGRASLPATVSIKLTQFGLDFSVDGCYENVRMLALKAQEIASHIEIDMESSEYTDRTLDVATRIAAEFPGTRAVIQAYLRRSAADIDRLNGLKMPVRLCKGAYDEPATVAFAGKEEVDANYVALTKMLLDRGTYPAIATHDEKMVAATLQYVRERKIDPSAFEFQMLYGIRRDLQQQIVGQGYRLRLYVPYGTAWYPYFMRRLAERPANVLFLVKNLLKP